jgi:hypothetical protein
MQAKRAPLVGRGDVGTVAVVSEQIANAIERYLREGT